MGDNAYVHHISKPSWKRINQKKLPRKFKDRYHQASRTTGLQHANDDVLRRAHRTFKLKQCAHDLGIELVFVPAGGIWLYQPPDQRVFGEPKSWARHPFFQLAGQTGVQGAIPDEVITILVR
jgi:hypothetical protein